MSEHTVTEEDLYWLRRAIGLSRLCSPAEGAFSVGAVVVGADGTELATGYSRENDLVSHAEETALGKLAPDDPRLPAATIYSTLEPCSQRRSRPLSCTALILAAGIRRVVTAWREPDLFVADCVGVESLSAGGATVIEVPELASFVRQVNAHLPGSHAWAGTP